MRFQFCKGSAEAQGRWPRDHLGNTGPLSQRLEQGCYSCWVLPFRSVQSVSLILAVFPVF